MIRVAPSVRSAELFALLLILVAAAWLRFATIDYSLSYDEVVAAIFARQPFGLLWSDWMVRETNPPLFYSLLGVWTRVLGDDPVAVRSLSAVLGLSVIGLAWACIRRLTGDGFAALAAAALLAVSPVELHFSQFVRAYMLSVVGALIAFHGLIDLCSWRARDRMPDRRALLWALSRYGLGTLIALYTHTMMALLPLLANLAMAAVMLPDWRARRWLLPWWIGINAIFLLLWAWWGWITLRQVGNDHDANLICWTVPTAAEALWMVRESFAPVNYGAIGWVAKLAIPLIFLHALWRGRYRSAMLMLLAAALLVPVLLFAISQYKPVFAERTIFWASVPFILALALAIAALPRPWVGGVALALLVVASLAQYGHKLLPRRQLDRYDVAVADLLKDPARPVIVQDEGMALTIDYYCGLQVHGACPLTQRIYGPRETHTWYQGQSRKPFVDRAQLHAMVAGRPFATVQRNPDLEGLIMSLKDSHMLADRRNFGWGVQLGRWEPLPRKVGAR